jgi:hypothetical protein
MTKFTQQPNTEAETENTVGPAASAGKAKQYVENISEATAAFLFAMVQGKSTSLRIESLVSSVTDWDYCRRTSNSCLMDG